MNRLLAAQLYPIFERMVNLVDEGVLITDPNLEDMPIVFANNGFTKITGYDANEVIGKNPRFLRGPETDVNATNKIKSCISNKKNGSVNILNYKKDGSKFWNHFSITPIIDDLGSVTHWIGIERDISPLIELIQNKSNEHSMVVTINTMNDIINNFLNALILFRQTMEDEYKSKELVDEFDSIYKKFMKDYKQFNQIETFREKKLSDDLSVLDFD